MEIVKQRTLLRNVILNVTEKGQRKDNLRSNNGGNFGVSDKECDGTLIRFVNTEVLDVLYGDPTPTLQVLSTVLNTDLFLINVCV